MGIDPWSVAVADLDGDTIPDLVTANRTSDDVSVLLGNGDGTFQAAVSFAVGGRFEVPWAVAVADLDGDTVPDVVTANAGQENLGVLLGNGDGTFQAAVSFGGGDRSVAAADLDGDAVPDLLAGQFGYFGGGEHVGVLLGNGDGTFQSGGAFAAGTSPISVAVADLDGDTVPDGVTANADSDDVSVLLGNGDGTFQADLSFAVSNSPWSVAVADLDGDTVPDVVTANEGSNDVSVLRNLSDRGVPVLSPGALALLAALLAGTGSVVRIRTRRTTSFSR